MKLLMFVLITGSILLYFLNIALLKTPDINWLTHGGLRFFAGFLVLGISSFYAKAITFKIAIIITLVIDLANYYYAYSTGAYRLQFEIVLHGVYMMTWGALVGYLTAKWIKNKMEKS